jgi:nicotianamine synthase
MKNSGTSPTSTVDPGHPRSDHIGRGTRTAPPPHRPALVAGRHRGATAEVCALYEALATQPSLAPGPRVDELFGRLVELTVAMPAAEADEVLADPAIEALRPRLQRLCAAGETELERVWATRIATSPDPAATLAGFPYLENYRLLVELEWSAVVGAAGGRRPTRVAFVGSGPLPLSAVLLARDHDVVVDSFDRDPGAVRQARAVVDALGLPRLRVRYGDTAMCPRLHDVDVVVLAALVGATPEAKRAVVTQVNARMRPGALLAVRSAHAARSLLYPVLDLDALDGLELLSVVHPFNQVINSIVLARTPAGPGVQATQAGPGVQATQAGPSVQATQAGSDVPTPTAAGAVPNDEVRPWPAT